MRILGTLAAWLALFGLLGWVAPALAHDVEVTLDFDDLLYQDVLHEDEDPWKGWFTATVSNSSGEPWGAFHFMLIRDLSALYPTFTQPSEVFFSTADGPFQIVGWDAGDYSWQISQDGLRADFLFHGNPIAPSETATFKVYTDNTVNQQPFAMFLYPTPVPEPSTLALLAFSGIGLLGYFAGRRRG